jgi:uncharacterized membrane protein
MSVFRIIKDIVRRQFLSGVLVVVPLILTYVVLRFLFETVDGILSPLIFKLIGYTIPGLGIIATLLLILITGFLTRNIIGSTLYRYGERFLVGTPIIRIVYLAAKQLVEAITIPNVKSFKEVVMIEYPRTGLYAIGFATTRVRMQNKDDSMIKMVGVFIPSTPTPISGMVVFIPEKDLITLDISVEETLKFLVSGGILSPPDIKWLNHNTITKIEGNNASG